MRKKIIIVSIILLTIFLSSNWSQAGAFFKGFSLKLHGGYGYLSVGDLNTVSENWITNTQNRWNPSIVEGKFNKFNQGLEFGGEFLVNLTKNLGLGVGVEQILRNKSSLIWMYKLDDSGPLIPMYWTYYDEAKLSALAVKLSAYYSFFPISWLSISLQAGLGYYFGKIHNVHLDNYFFDQIVDFGVWGFTLGHSRIYHPHEIDVEDNALGFHGGIGFEFNVTDNFFFFIEGIGRSIKLNDWEGDEAEWPKKGKLYYVEFESGDTYFYVWETTPPFGILARKAIIDLTGVSFKAGIKIKF